VDIVIQIDEGKPYRLNDITLEGTKVFSNAQVRQSIRLKPGEVASWGLIQKASQSIRDFYGSRGYIRTDVNAEVEDDAALGTADVQYHVTEGSLAYINNIDIRGNTRTKDKVIRRELAVYPGEIYNEVKVRTSENRLRNLGYFSYVNSMSEGTLISNQYDLVLDVEEQKTGQFMVGAGFSSIDSILGFVELSQGNFDLFGWPYFTGGGQKVKLRTQFGTERTDYELSFVEPWFLNRRLSLGLDLYHHDSRFLSDEYDQRNTGGSITLGKPLTSFDRLNLTYGLEEIQVLNVSSNASELIKQEEGNRTKSYTTLEVVHDSRNNSFIPTRGNRSSISGTLAGGPLGGNTDLYGFQGRLSQFVSPWFDHVINLRGWAATVEEYGDSDRVPIFDRLFLGGARTVRAFAFRDVGPKDDTGEPIGGRSALYGTVEYTIPLAEKFRAAVFYDVGVVWEDTFAKSQSAVYVGDGAVNSGVGLGVRLDFPGFPIQLDYSWPIDADIYNDRSSGRFSFWIGYTY
ncbi:MAG: outer membrane protein assembly factor BamA, partial [Lentisphaerota bacterium]